MSVTPVYRRLLASPPFLRAEVKLYRADRYRWLSGTHRVVLRTWVPTALGLLRLGPPEATRLSMIPPLLEILVSGVKLLEWLLLNLRQQVLMPLLLNSPVVIGVQFLEES